MFNNNSPFYNSNPKLPKAGLEREYTPDQIIEMQKCAEDILYFGNNYFYVVHQKHGKMQMKLYDYQEEAVTKYQKTGKIVMATARQAGKTSVATVIILHAAIFNKDKNIALLANRKATAKKILARIKLAYEELPDWMKVGVKEWNKESVEFENGTKIFADATEGNSVRGESVFLLYVDEHAFIEDYETFSSAVLPTVSSNDESKIIFTSTPNGLNWFFDYYTAAKEGKSEYELIEAPWWRVPGRDQVWADKTLADLNYNQIKFDQEYALEFAGSSGTLISGATLKILEHIQPLQTEQCLNIYKPVDGNHIYTLVADTSRGKGLDHSAFHVIDVTSMPYEQVATYYNNLIEPTDFAAIIDRIGRYYNNAFTLIELNDLGQQVADLLFLDYEYESMLMTKSRGRAGKQISSDADADRGITTSQPVRNTGCGMIKSIIEQQKLKIFDKNTIEEMKVFSLKGNKYQAEEGKHDDLMMGLVLFGWLTAQQYFKDLTDSNVMENLREMSSEDVDDFMLSLGIVTDGTEDIHDNYAPQEVSHDAFNEWMMG